MWVIDPNHITQEDFRVNEWNESKIRDAGNHINNLPQNKNLPDRQWVFGDYDDVRVGIIKRDGKVTTIIPDNSKQP
ncbi:hypothetical protein [Enterococcus sp. AZ126]|uniref:hypothetical protein n=1 Tax=Enterococcus sp. AZ126 TaxID=2774635 RepID=UPI003F277C5D